MLPTAVQSATRPGRRGCVTGGHLLHREHLGDRGGVGVDQRCAPAVLLGQPVIGQTIRRPAEMRRV
jgi:hypothetical protein